MFHAGHPDGRRGEPESRGASSRPPMPDSAQGMAMHGADAPLWGGTAATFLAAREIWDEAARADGEESIRAQAVLDWRPSTRTRYRSAISQLVETERQRPDLGLQEVLAESLAVRSDQGQSASGMRGIIAAVRALEDLCWGDGILGILVAALPSPLLVLWRRRCHDAIVSSCVFSRRAQTTALPVRREVRFSSNHLEERLLDQAQARASYTPVFWGHSRSIPQGMILDVQPLVKSLFCPIRPSPNGFFDTEASIP